MKNGKPSQSKNKTKSRPPSGMPRTREKPCSDCGGQVGRKTVTEEFEREGIRINISGFEAWVCSSCGATYFEPAVADKLVQAANSLFELARAGNKHKGAVLAQVA